jgi:class 3 adenylate cyclase
VVVAVDPDRAGSIVPGDRVLDVGGVALDGAGPIEVAAAFAQADPQQPIPVLVARGERRQDLALATASYARYAPRLVASLLFAACALVLLRRARSSPAATTLVFTNLCAAIFFACTFAGDGFETRASVAVHVLSLGLAAPLGLRVVQLFPRELPPKGRLARLLPWAFAPLALFDASRFYAMPFSREVGAAGANLLGLAYVAVAFATVRHNWRQAGALARRQLKWMLLGGYLAVLPFAALLALTAADARFGPFLAIAIVSLALFPVFWIIGMIRFNWFDVDRLLSAAASYTLLLVAALAFVMTAAPVLAASVSATTGVGDGVARLAMSVGLAGLLVPLHRRLRPQIDRVFFAERFALERGIERLGETVGACATPEETAVAVGSELERLLHPDACRVYLRREGCFEAVFARGRGGPPVFPERSALVAAIEEQRAPIGLEMPGDGRHGAADAFQRAALETLAAELVIPVRHDAALAGFLALGAKRSGDVYTTTDRALLAAVGDRVAGQLRHLEQLRARSADRAASERVRRYVPGSLAERLDRGEDVELGELEVSVLFADLCGYSGFAEPRAPSEIFSAVSRYADTVARSVREHGGTVVEFAGDGVMAVFGAPQPLPGKEAAAVAAALAIERAVRELALGGEQRLAVGIGVATGPSYVGSVRASDRLIWTALGNTTNLASRLQAMTREQDASILLDERTWAAAKPADFERVAGLAIRGREATETVYRRAPVPPATVSASAPASAPTRS